ncbi:MAG: glycosyltransferase [Anaerolineaceae bacterium]|nr:glycosyltransferase [Anaerolineaceae bacterium]
MKIAYLVKDYGLISETFITDLIEGLAKTDHDLVILANDATSVPPLPVKLEKTGFLVPRSIIDKLSYRINRLRGSVGEQNIYHRQRRYAQHCLKPNFEKYAPDVAYIDYGPVAAFTWPTLVELGIPFVVHFHGSDITSALNNTIYRQELQQVFAHAAALIVASNHVRRLLVLEGAPPGKIHVVRYGLNLADLEPLSWVERQQHPPSIIFLGRFTPKKHPVALIEAFALVKQEVAEAQLSLIGAGLEMDRVKRRIEQRQLSDSIKLYGALPHEEALPILNRHWIYAQHSVTAPSGDQEGFGISLAEAAALELPVVSTLHNGIPEQVIDGETGFLVSEFDYETMARRIVQLLQDIELAKRMGQCGSRHIRQICSIERRVAAITTILADAAKS